MHVINRGRDRQIQGEIKFRRGGGGKKRKAEGRGIDNIAFNFIKRTQLCLLYIANTLCFVSDVDFFLRLFQLSISDQIRGKRSLSTLFLLSED